MAHFTECSLSFLYPSFKKKGNGILMILTFLFLTFSEFCFHSTPPQMLRERIDIPLP